MIKDENIIIKSSYLSVAELFQIQANKTPKSIAVINSDGKKYSYLTFMNRVLCLSSFLISKGLKHGDRVSIISENCIEYFNG